MPKYVVRYGSMRHLGVFSCRARELYARGQKVIARTARGQELGEVLCEATDHVVSQMGPDPQTGQILRLESSEDHIEMRRLHQQEVGEFETCRNRVAELALDMQLVQVERLYGGERVIIYYLSEQRVDFRELVKLLARDLQTRVEMRQIGVRDEAKLLADYGDCGKPVCCNTHLAEMPPVSMKMAKLQRATLDPTKISGRCGRLKCCLRYEYDTYQELQRELPRVGAEVLTREGKAKILSQEILTGELLVETEDHRRIVIQASDVLTVVGKPSRGNDEGQPGEAADEGDGPSPRSSHDARSNRGPRGGRPTSYPSATAAPSPTAPPSSAMPPAEAVLPPQELPPSPEGPPPPTDDGGENP